ncbi:ABC transporter permease [Paenibacillaceae bacterium WGS1546]|uniref:ABC transporter permease n=1 Tax=Cohnella sp. WGS1546 TaxID=3366810 RepID=UPI00372D7CDD
MLTADKKIGANARFVWMSWKANLASAMEYRLSFVLLAGMMFVNNFIWLFFWRLFFGRFPIVQGWELHDVMLLWAISTGGFGWAAMLFGNFSRIAGIVATGQLDVYLSQPRPVLLSVLVSRCSVTAAGDFAFALAVFAMVGDLSLRGIALFALGLLISGLLFIAVMVIAGCSAFWIGNAEGMTQQLFNSFIALTTYPSDIFRGLVKLALFTIVPAGFISYMPIGLLRDFDPVYVALATGVAFGLTIAGALIFRAGLRRYASGNTIAMRS